MIVPREPLAADAVARHYDVLDAFYRDAWGDHVHHGLWTTGKETREQAVRDLVTWVADRAGIEKGTRVLDVGCGYGATARMLAEERRARVMGVTISPAQHRVAVSQQETNEGNPRFVLGDALDADLGQGSHDVVVMIESSEHFADKAGLLRRCRSWLRPGGKVALCAWMAAEEPKRWQVRHLLEPICREGRLPGMGSELDHRRLFAEAGFRVADVADLTSRVKKTWPACMARVARSALRDPRYLKFLLSDRSGERVFALTVARIWLAYEVGAMRYVAMFAEATETAGLESQTG